MIKAGAKPHFIEAANLAPGHKVIWNSPPLRRYGNVPDAPAEANSVPLLQSPTLALVVGVVVREEVFRSSGGRRGINGLRGRDRRTLISTKNHHEAKGDHGDAEELAHGDPLKDES